MTKMNYDACEQDVRLYLKEVKNDKEYISKVDKHKIFSYVYRKVEAEIEKDNSIENYQEYCLLYSIREDVEEAYREVLD